MGVQEAIASLGRRRRLICLSSTAGFGSISTIFFTGRRSLFQPQNRSHNLALTKLDADGLEQLSAGERSAWNEAPSRYSRFVKRDLLFDDELIQDGPHDAPSDDSRQRDRALYAVWIAEAPFPIGIDCWPIGNVPPQTHSLETA